VGTNNKARRAAKKRDKKRTAALGKGPIPGQEPQQFRLLDDGTMVPGSATRPYDTIYYDEPDFMHECPSCGNVSGAPMHSMRLRPGVEKPVELANVCPECGEKFAFVAREEPQPDGSLLLTIDREVLESAGYVEWAPRSVLGVTLRDPETGELVEFAVSNSKRKRLVVCDDCGLPFEMPGEQAFTTRSGANVDVDLRAGPCEHCGGLGHPLMITVTEGGLRTVSNSATFANAVVVAVAEGVRNGLIDLSEAAARLRAQEQKPLTQLADWIETRPVSAMVAATMIQVVASLVGPQVPLLLEKDPEIEQTKVPATYTEDEVADLVVKILEHYDETHQHDGVPKLRSSRGKSKPGDR